MVDEVSAKLKELPTLDKPALRALWQQLFSKPAHPRIRRELMIARSPVCLVVRGRMLGDSVAFQPRDFR
jgi:hypothetical protein